MQLTLVESSMIHAAGYDEATKELEIIFNSGHIYRYRDVPQRVFDELLAAESKGQFMHANVLGVYAEYRLSRRPKARRRST